MKQEACVGFIWNDSWFIKKTKSCKCKIIYHKIWNLYPGALIRCRRLHSSIKYVAAIIILSPVIGKLRDLTPQAIFSTLHDFKMVLGKNENFACSPILVIEKIHAWKLKRMMNGKRSPRSWHMFYLAPA